MKIREQAAHDCMTDTIKWLQREGDVAVLDATNCTKDRRKTLYKMVEDNIGVIKLINNSFNMS